MRGIGGGMDNIVEDEAMRQIKYRASLLESSARSSPEPGSM